MFNLQFAPVLANWPMFVSGAKLTLELALVATVAGFLFGTFCAIGLRGRPAVAKACGVYVEAIRNTPLLV